MSIWLLRLGNKMKIFQRECYIMAYYTGENQPKPSLKLVGRDLGWRNVCVVVTHMIVIQNSIWNRPCAVSQCKRNFAILKATEFVIFENEGKRKINKKLCHVNVQYIQYNTTIRSACIIVYATTNQIDDRLTTNVNHRPYK